MLTQIDVKTSQANVILFCATAELKDTHSILWTLSKMC